MITLLGHQIITPQRRRSVVSFSYTTAVALEGSSNVKDAYPCNAIHSLQSVVMYYLLNAIRVIDKVLVSEYRYEFLAPAHLALL